MIRVLRALDWLFSTSAAHVMAQKPKIGKNSTPSKGNHGYFLTHGHNSPAD